MTDRVVYCPSCARRYDVARDLVADATMVLLCGQCGHAARVSVFERTDEVERDPATRALEEAQLPRVVIGHEVPSAARTIAGVLRAASFSPVCVRGGEQVLAACDPAMPSQPVAVVLDVAVQGVLAFEVIEQMRAHPATKAVPIVLLASVFERTRYKRRPTNLYGADAYLELHHVPDRLVTLIESLRDAEPRDQLHLQAPVERARAASLRTPLHAADVEAARTLARRLLSDVALYNGDELARGVRSGDPFREISAAVQAARELFLTATSTSEVFDEELFKFGDRLLERYGKGRGSGASDA